MGIALRMRRPILRVIAGGLLAYGILALILGQDIQAGLAIGGLIGLGGKLTDSEEKGKD